MIDLGDTKTISVIFTSDGTTLINPASVVLTITLPDGTSWASPANFAVVNDSTGLFHYDYPTTQAGRHVARWVGTNPNAVDVQTFDVAPADPGFLFSLDRARTMMRIPSSDTSQDETVRSYLAAVTQIVELLGGPQIRANKTEIFDGGKSSVQLAYPPTLITSVTESGITLQANADYTADMDAGLVWRGTIRLPYAFFYGIQNVVVQYTTGGGVTAPNVRLAAEIILKSIYTETQEGPRPGFGTNVADESTVQDVAGYLIPNQAAELLRASPGNLAVYPGFA